MLLMPKFPVIWMSGKVISAIPSSGQTRPSSGSCVGSQEVSGGVKGRTVWELKRLLCCVRREETFGGSGLPQAQRQNPVGWRQDAKEKPFSERGPGLQKVFTGPRCLASEGQAAPSGPQLDWMPSKVLSGLTPCVLRSGLSGVLPAEQLISKTGGGSPHITKPWGGFLESSCTFSIHIPISSTC